MNDERQATTEVPTGKWRVKRLVVSFLLGAILAVIIHYAFYRMSMPLEPFIYVAF